MSPIPAQASAAIGGRSFDLTARLGHATGDEGVLFATGTENSGMSWFVQGDRLVFDYNFFGEHHVLESDRPVPTGPSEVGLRFTRNDKGATVTLVIAGADAGTGELDRIMRMMSSVGPSVGYDHGSPVSDRYTAPFAFTGRLRRLDVDVDPAGKHREQATVEHAVEMGRQ
jgi:arylsulfatase